MAIINFFIDDWRNFAKNNNGSIKHAKTGLSPIGFGMSVWKKLYLTIPFYDSEIVFLSGEATRMQIYYKFKNNIDFNFILLSEDNLDKIGKFLHLTKEINIQSEEFDKNFLIKSNNEILIKKILDLEIQNFLLKNKRYFSNYKLERNKTQPILEFNAAISENNLQDMERILSIMKKTIDCILNYEK